MHAAPALGEAFREALLREKGALHAAEVRDVRQTWSLIFATRKARHAVHA
mgnify:FL=1|jgi:hypothetical protein